MSVEHEATILADLRRTHAQLKAGDTMRKNPTAWSMRLTIEEVDVLLAIVDERDELRRELCDDWEPGYPPVTVVPSKISVAMPAVPVAAIEINTCPHAGTHHNCPLGGCPTFERREVVPMPYLEATPITGREYPCCDHCADPMRAGHGLVDKPHLHLIPCTVCGQTA